MKTPTQGKTYLSRADLDEKDLFGGLQQYCRKCGTERFDEDFDPQCYGDLANPTITPAEAHDFCMTLNEYQTRAATTAIYSASESEHGGLPYCALGLCGEAGEVANKIKKVLRDKGGDFTDPHVVQAIAAELGDVLWYLSETARRLGLTLEDVARMNQLKLASRKAACKLGGSGDDR